jgi:hypothetical protein
MFIFNATLLKNIYKRVIFMVRHESANLLVAESATEKMLTQHISYPALGRL